jgi:hypothetical protein
MYTMELPPSPALESADPDLDPERGAGLLLPTQ